MTIDDADRRILDRLQTRADEPLEELGRAVGLSRNAVWRRIRTLEDKGILRGRVALIDPDAVGVGLTVFIQIRAARHTADWLDTFRRAIRSLPEIMGAYRMTGDLDYLIRARVSSVADYDRLYQRLIEKVDLGDVSAAFVMESIADTHKIPIR